MALDWGIVQGFFSTVWSSPGSFFLAPESLIYLWLLAGLIILYLIRPKPKHHMFPSLMFLMGEHGKKKRNSLFQSLLRNLLLLLQLLALLFLVLALAKPFISELQSVNAKNTVIVLDISASMQTWVSPTSTRFMQAREALKNQLGETNTVILAGRTPSIFLRDADPQTVLAELITVTPVDTTTNLKDALILAGEAGEENRIVALSDFQETDPDVELDAVRNALEARGHEVVFVPTTSKTNNAGIIDVLISEENVKVFVKNFNDEEKKATLAIGTESKDLLLAPKSTEVVAFTLPQGDVHVQLSPSDDLAVDNEAFLTMPTQNKLRVLLITNDEATSNLESALKSIPFIELEKAKPPIVPDINHDVVIFKDVVRSSLLQGKIEEIEKRVQEGMLFIPIVQQDIFAFDFGSMVPLRFIEEKKGDTPVIVNVDHPFTTDVNIGILKRYFRMETTHEVTVLARTQSGDPLITFEARGKGGILFYGLFDKESDFVITPDYPIFWGNIMDEIRKHKNSFHLNVDTGRIVPLEEDTRVTTPKETITTKVLALNQRGFYRWGEFTMAANLLSAGESDLNREPSLEETVIEDAKTDESSANVKTDITIYALLVALIVLLLELSYTKYRGDI